MGSVKYMRYLILFSVIQVWSVNGSFFVMAQNIQDLEQKVEQYRAEGNTATETEYLNRLAYMYWDNEQFNEAIESFERLAELNASSNNKKGRMIIFSNLGMLHTDVGDYQNAFNAYNESVKISRQLNNKPNIASNLTNAATALQGMNEPERSNKYVEEAMSLAKELNDLKILRTCYRILAENHEKLGNTEKTIQYFDLYDSFDKKIKNEQMKEIKAQSEEEVSKAEAAKRAKEMELKHTVDTLREVKELTKMQKMEIDLLNKENQIKELKVREQEAQLRNERLIRKSLIIGIILVLGFSSIILRLFLQKKKANQLLAEQNHKINQQNLQIKSSINYAQTIQQAILPMEDVINNDFDIFIIYRPKDIVSGDFYWFNHRDEDQMNLLAAVDCTGHGVPGAFMSMIGNTLLNIIINEKRMTSPAEILEELNTETRTALKQDQTDNNDGMDLALCTISKNNKGTYDINFSGAKRPLYFYKRNTKQLELVKGDRISIGGYGKSKEKISFTNHQLELAKGDMIYLCSDGIIDQNGPDRKRFGSKRLINLLSDIAEQPLNEQKEKIETELDKYKKEEEQRDDITLIGLRIK